MMILYKDFEPIYYLLCIATLKEESALVYSTNIIGVGTPYHYGNYICREALQVIFVHSLKCILYTYATGKNIFVSFSFCKKKKCPQIASLRLKLVSFSYSHSKSLDTL